MDFARTGDKRRLLKQLESAIDKIASSEFPESLKTEFALRDDVTSEISATLTHLVSLRKNLDQ